MTGKIETGSLLHYGSQVRILALKRLTPILFGSVAQASSRRLKTASMKKRGDISIPQSPDTAIWYNAAMREAGQRRGF